LPLSNRFVNKDGTSYLLQDILGRSEALRMPLYHYHELDIAKLRNVHDVVYYHSYKLFCCHKEHTILDSSPLRNNNMININIY